MQHRTAARKACHKARKSIQAAATEMKRSCHLSYDYKETRSVAIDADCGKLTEAL